MDTVIVTPELAGISPHGGIGTFVWHFAGLLRSVDHNVTILLTRHRKKVSGAWYSAYRDMGIQVDAVAPRMFAPNSVGAWDFVEAGRGVHEAIADRGDIVYLQDWLADGFVPMRANRLHAGRRKVFVNVLHSPTSWIREAMGQYPRHVLHDLSLDYAERYVAEHADVLVSPSRYMLDWTRARGWTLPDGGRVSAIGYPFLPGAAAAPPSRNAVFRRIAFLGRFEVRKGAGFFVGALRHLHARSPDTLAAVQEIAFLGRIGNTKGFTPGRATKELGRLNAKVVFHRGLDTLEVRQLLTSWTTDTLVVVPSLQDNYPYAVIEASLVPGLNLICSKSGETREILSEAADDQFFEPSVDSLARRLEGWLQDGPRHASRLCAYDWKRHNQWWLAFHDRVCRVARQREATAGGSARALPCVDICIPYFNHGQHLPQLLEALHHQRADGFSVTVIDDGSTDPVSQRVFVDMDQRYADAGWRFVRLQANQGLCAARNAAAAQGQGEYLLFLDADNVPAPGMVRQLVTAIRTSGVDCLSCGFRAFRGAAFPYELGGGGTTCEDVKQQVRTEYDYLPLGACIPMGLFDNFFGDATFIVKRSVFETLHGFGRDPRHRHLVHEDYEFLLRLVLAGFTLDVLPKLLFFYRVTERGLTRSSNEFHNRLRVQEVYERLFTDAGMSGLSPYIYGLYERGKPMEFLVEAVKRFIHQPVQETRTIVHAAWRRLEKRRSGDEGAGSV